MYKYCPLRANGTFGCLEENCGWWCEWAKCCAMVAIPAELSDRMHDLMKTMESNYDDSK